MPFPTRGTVLFPPSLSGRVGSDSGGSCRRSGRSGRRGVMDGEEGDRMARVGCVPPKVVWPCISWESAVGGDGARARTHILSAVVFARPETDTTHQPQVTHGNTTQLPTHVLCIILAHLHCRDMSDRPPPPCSSPQRLSSVLFRLSVPIDGATRLTAGHTGTIPSTALLVG